MDTPPTVLSYRRAEQAADAPDNCYRCGYPLLGIADEQACPECGLLARRSRRPTDELHNTRPRWLARISRGANLILLAVVFAAVWPFAWDLLRMRAYRIFPTSLWNALALWNTLPLLGLDVAAVLLFAGTWLLTSAESYPPADRADRRLRMGLRAWAAVPLAAVFVQHVRRGYGGTFPGVYDWFDRDVWLVIAWVLFTAALAPLPLLLFARLRGLAKRARSAQLAEHCTIVGVGTSAAFAFCGLVAIVAYHADDWGLGDHWMNRSTAALIMLLVPAVAAALFTLWSLQLFVRFALAFRRAARELRGKWTSDDASLAPAPIPPTLTS